MFCYGHSHITFDELLASVSHSKEIREQSCAQLFPGPTSQPPLPGRAPRLGPAACSVVWVCTKVRVMEGRCLGFPYDAENDAIRD